MELRCEAVCDREAMAALKPVWRKLQDACPDATPFQTWEWNDAWMQFFGAGKQPLLLLFYDSGSHPVGLAPLCIGRHLGTPLRRLAWIGTGSSDYLGPLALPGYGRPVADALLEALPRQSTRWDVASLQQIRAFWPLGSAEGAAPERDRCPYLPLPASWELLTAGLSKKMRYNVGYYRRLLERTYEDASVTTAQEENLPEAMTALFSLHKQRWNQRWLPGTLIGPRVQGFHREAASRFLQQGMLRLHLLYAEGAYRAALYCFSFQNRTFYYQAGFSPEYSRISPGTILVAQAIRTAVEEGHAEFDFLRGDEPYKFRWQPQLRENRRLFLQRRTPAGAVTLPARAGEALNRLEQRVEGAVLAYAQKRSQAAPKE